MTPDALKRTRTRCFEEKQEMLKFPNKKHLLLFLPIHVNRPAITKSCL
jgi:hypothetical protein